MNYSGRITRQVFEEPIVQLAALCPICALSALSPTAALSALSPTLARFNPALNPAAALLAFGFPHRQVHALVQARVSAKLASTNGTGPQRFR